MARAAAQACWTDRGARGILNIAFRSPDERRIAASGPEKDLQSLAGLDRQERLYVARAMATFCGVRGRAIQRRLLVLENQGAG